MKIWYVTGKQLKEWKWYKERSKKDHNEVTEIEDSKVKVEIRGQMIPSTKTFIKPGQKYQK